jgi:hypothetical protein
MKSSTTGNACLPAEASPAPAPGSVADRVARLPEALQALVRGALGGDLGVLVLKSVDPAWKSQLERSGVGSIESLNVPAFDLHGRHLVLHPEAMQSLLDAERVDVAGATIQSAGDAFLDDLSAIHQHLQQAPARVGSYGDAIEQAKLPSGILRQPSNYLIEAGAMKRLLLSIGRTLRFWHIRQGRLQAIPFASDWVSASVRDRRRRILGDVINRFLSEVLVLRDVLQPFLEVASGMEPGRWYPKRYMSRLALRRLLETQFHPSAPKPYPAPASASFEEDEEDAEKFVDDEETSPPNSFSPHTRLTAFQPWEQVVRNPAVEQWVDASDRYVLTCSHYGSALLVTLGLMDLALRGQEVAGIRLTSAFRETIVADGASGEPWPERPLSAAEIESLMPLSAGLRFRQDGGNHALTEFRRLAGPAAELMDRLRSSGGFLKDPPPEPARELERRGLAFLRPAASGRLALYLPVGLLTMLEQVDTRYGSLVHGLSLYSSEVVSRIAKAWGIQATRKSELAGAILSRARSELVSALSALTPNEKAILDFVVGHGGIVSRRDLQKAFSLPIEPGYGGLAFRMGRAGPPDPAAALLARCLLVPASAYGSYSGCDIAIPEEFYPSVFEALRPSSAASSWIDPPADLRSDTPEIFRRLRQFLVAVAAAPPRVRQIDGNVYKRDWERLGEILGWSGDELGALAAIADRLKLTALSGAAVSIQDRESAFLDHPWPDRARGLRKILIEDPWAAALLQMLAEGHPRCRRIPDLPAAAAISPPFRPLRRKAYRDGGLETIQRRLERARAMLGMSGLAERHGDLLRASPLGLHLLDRAPLPPEPPPDAACAYLQPNFEMLLPLGWPLKRFAKAARFADLVRVDRVVTFRVSKSSILRALDLGTSIDDIRAFLRETGAPLPSPVEFLLDEIGRREGEVRVIPAGAILVVRDPALLEALRHDRSLKGAFGEVAGPQAVTVQPGQDIEDLTRQLKKAGYVARIERGAGPRLHERR